MARKVDKERFKVLLKIMKKFGERKFSLADVYKEFTKEFDAGTSEILKVIYLLEDVKLVSVERNYSASVRRDAELFNRPQFTLTPDKYRRWKAEFIRDIVAELVSMENPTICLDCGHIFEFEYTCPKCGSYNILFVEPTKLKKYLINYLNKISDAEFIYLIYTGGRNAIIERVKKHLRRKMNDVIKNRANVEFALTY